MSTVHILLTALLVVNGAYANSEKVLVTKWDTPYCSGHPVGKQIKLKAGKCEPFYTGAFKVSPYKNRKDLDCHLNVYDSSDCYQKQGDFAAIPLPEQFDQCYPVSYPQGGSFQLICKPHKARAHNETSPAALPVAARAAPAPVHDAKMEARTDWNIKYLWMKHPFVGTEVCYRCFTDHKTSFNDFECHSKAEYTSVCSASDRLEPLPQATEHKIETFYLATAAETSTATVSETATVWLHPSHPSAVSRASKSKNGLKERSKKQKVNLQSPYFPEEIWCAEAKWKHEGKKNARVQIKHTKKGACKGAYALYKEPVTVTKLTPTTVPYVLDIVATTTMATTMILPEKPTWAA